MLNLSNVCFASSFENIRERIQKNELCHIDYNFSKTAAVVNVDCNSAIYINFKTKKVQTIVKNWPNVFPIWKSDTMVYVQGSCGTGCSQSIIFVAPATSISCPVHEYRIDNLSQDEPPDFYNNNPLLIEPHKEIYVCYAENDIIQVFKMPRKLQETIHPPNGYYAESAIIRDHHLMIIYRNKNENLKQIEYQKILL